MLSCRSVTEIITEYLEGRLTLWDRLRFQMHIGMCRHCREYLSQMKKTVRALGQLPVEKMPDEVRQELVRRFRDWTTAG